MANIKLGTHELSTRIVMPPMATAKSTEDGKVTADLVQYYDDRAANKHVSMIITEHAYVAMQGKASAGQMSMADDSVIEGLKPLTDAIHKHGKLAFTQLNHAGSATTSEITGCTVVSASAVVNPGRKAGLPGVVPTMLSESAIEGVKDDFLKAALRAKAGGFDGVEIHCAHGYLLNQFYSPLTNKRSDRYGCQTILCRMQLTLDIVSMIKAAAPDLLIAVRLGGCDYMEGGSTIDDAVQACRLLQMAGVDLIDLTGGMCRFTREGHSEAGYFSDMSEAVTKAVSTPVLVTGGVTKPEEAEALLAAGKADLIGVGRALLKDANWGL